MPSSASNGTQTSLHENLTPWSIFLFADYFFQNTWETRDKYGIILSNKDIYISIILCFTTSKVEKYKENLSPSEYIFIPAGTWWIFTKDTLILIRRWNIHEIERSKLPWFSPKYLWKLDQPLFEELLSKFRNSPEISNHHKWLFT